MIQLLLVLTPIALLDSTSVTPVALVPLLTLMGGRRPYLGPLMFILGTLIAYLGFGLLLVLGLESLFKGLNAWFERVWTRPDTPDVMLQIVIGLVLVILAMRIAGARRRAAGKDVGDVSPGAAFAAGAGFTLVGLPGALPYFAGLDQILRADLGFTGGFVALLFYNLIVVVPMVGIVFVRSAFGARGEALLLRVNAFMEVWMPRATIVLLVVLGIVLVVDGIAWFQGRPFLPT